MNDYTLKVQNLKYLGMDCWQLVLNGEVPQFNPGQFGLLSTGKADLLLPRPLGVSAQHESGIELLFRVVGKGTAIFSQLQPGEKVTFRGPAGRAFRPMEGNVLALAGTLGVVPLLFWRQKYGEFGALALGVPNGMWRGFADFVQERVPELLLYSDDGSIGRPGSCLRALTQEESDGVVACGPNGMLKALSEMMPPGKPWQVSLERRMGCGFGGCHGCVVPLKSGLKRLCVDGPVLDGNEVLWHELA